MLHLQLLTQRGTYHVWVSAEFVDQGMVVRGEHGAASDVFGQLLHHGGGDRDPVKRGSASAQFVQNHQGI
jgi:hypothetical protein